MVRMKYLIYLGFIISHLSYAEITIYEWTDKKGNKHYSDFPKNKSKIISLSQKNIISPAVVKSPNAEITKEELKNKESSNKNNNYTLNIISPLDDTSIRSNAGDISLDLSVKPEKESTQKVQLLIDGIPQGEPQNSLRLTATNIDRGEHKLSAQLISEDSKILATTEPVLIHLVRASLLNNAINQLGNIAPLSPSTQPNPLEPINEN